MEFKEELDERDLEIIIEELEKIESKKEKKEHTKFSFTKANTSKIPAGITTEENFKRKLNFHEISYKTSKERSTKEIERKLDIIDKKEDKEKIRSLFIQEIEDRLEIIFEKLNKERNLILSNGLLRKQVLDVKLSVQKDIELEKL